MVTAPRRRSASNLRLGVLLMLLGWPLAAFGGAYASTAVPWAIVCVAWLIVLRPRPAGSLDRLLLLILGCIALQLVPLPAGMIRLIAPHSLAVRDQLAGLLTQGTFVRPLSIRAPDSEWALLVAAGAVAVFWIARETFADAGLRRAVRAVSLAGLPLSLLALLQAATSPRAIYWMVSIPPAPFGPFLNRHHFATWIIMALPLCLGALAARKRVNRQTSEPITFEWRKTAIILPDSRGAWLLLSAGLMMLALCASLSSSGIVGFSLSCLGAAALLQPRLERAGSLLFAGRSIVLGLLAFGLSLAWLGTRLSATPAVLESQIAIWRDTLAIVHDFWIVGTGAGTYRAAMLVYQSGGGIQVDQAQNHYLQLLAEGGLLLAIPAALVIMAFARAAAVAFRADRTPLTYIRAGAACGLAAVAIQSVWDNGLSMPANAALAATLAAIVVHHRPVVQSSDS